MLYQMPFATVVWFVARAANAAQKNACKGIITTTRNLSTLNGFVSSVIASTPTSKLFVRPRSNFLIHLDAVRVRNTYESRSDKRVRPRDAITDDNVRTIAQACDQYANHVSYDDIAYCV